MSEQQPNGPFTNYAPAVVNALQQKGLSGECPMCKKNQWVLHEVPVSMPVYEARGDNAGKVLFPGTSMPMAAMICRNCGFAGFFSLGALNLLGQPNAQGGATTPAPETK